MFKIINFGKEAHKGIQAGVDKLANVVKSTLGPGGNNVILQRGDTYGITKDGVSVAMDIYLEGHLERAGAQIVKEVAYKTVKEAGDGTTTSIVLAQAILNKGIKASTDIWGRSKTHKLIDVKRGIDLAVAETVRIIKDMSRPVEKGDIHKIADISANGDKEIAKLVGDAVGAVGLEGMVTVEDSNSNITELKRVEGFRWDRGYMSNYFVTNEAKMENQMDDVTVLIYDGAFHAVKELLPFFDKRKVSNEIAGKPLLIIAHDFSAEFVSTMAVNHKNGAIQCCLVQAPEFKEVRKEILHDIAAVTGATVITKDAGITPKDVSPKHLGHCGRIRVSAWNTTIIDGNGGLTASSRAHALREQIAGTDSNEHAEFVLKQRLSNLVNGLMVIYVGGGSQIEVKEKKDRIDDALNATRAAIEEGILPGGGMAYVRAKERLNQVIVPVENADQRMGVGIIESVLTIPFETIVENAGGHPAKVLLGVQRMKGTNGFNAKTMKYEDLMQSGVIDPTKVVRLCLENAASVAGMLLTTKATVLLK